MDTGGEVAHGITRDDVFWGYWYALGRAPESEEAIQSALSYESRERFRDALYACEEFKARHGTPMGRLPQSAPPLSVEWQTSPEIGRRLLDHVQETWTTLGKERPHWSVLSSDQFTPEHLEAHRVHFFASGAADTRDLLGTLRRAGVEPAGLTDVFEYGCGVGRVTPHLAQAFARVTACDISASHLKLAEMALADAPVSNVRVVLADVNDFGMTEPFDLWYSRIVLQHNPPPIIAMILKRALQMLRPGGVAAFQLPTYAIGYEFRIDDYLAGLASNSNQIEMHLLPQPAVFAIASEAGCEPIEVREEDGVGNPFWISSFSSLRKVC